VWEHDGGQCTFVAADGTRCTSCHCEIDHIIPKSRGGRSDPNNLRLRCRAHNQYAAEQMFGKQFMANKRAEAKAAAEKRRAEKAARKAAEEALDQDELMPCLRNLGFTIAEARFALEKCGPLGELEARLRRCLAVMLPPHHRRVSPAGAAAS
jgi:hypothetical protein